MSYSFTNKQISTLLREISAAYEVRGGNTFKVRAYDNAADAIEHATSEIKDLWESGNLKSVPGIGASIEAYLDELFRTGCVKHFDNVKKGIPRGMFELLRVPGIGAKTAYKLSKHFNLNRPDDAVFRLKELAEAGKIRDLEGFGEESEKKILENIKKLEKVSDRMLLFFADSLANKIIRYLKENPEVQQAHPLGSLRRRVATVGDVDISVATNNPVGIIEYFVKCPDISEVVNQGTAKATVLLKNGKQVDLRVQEPESYGSLLQYFTGSKAHNIHLRKLAIEKGLSLSEYGIRRGRKLYKFSDERSFYEFLGMEYIPPELREDAGEIETSCKNKLPRLIKTADIRGDLQMHTSLSDGENTLEEMIEACENMDYEYIGITDHQISLKTNSKTSIIGVINRQRKKIEHYNYSGSGMRVLFGLELDILANGELAYPNDLLKRFDYVVAGVHSGFDQPREKITKRLLTAVENPYIKFIAHPTGRVLGQREAYNADWDKIMDACIKFNKCLEINAYPTRLDLADTLVRKAVRRGVKLIINTDSHRVDHLKFMSYGISVARRGWCTKKSIINTRNLNYLLKFWNLRR